MDLLDRVVTRANQWAGYLAAAVCVAMVGLILIEIVLRTLFATSTFVLDEFVGYGVGIMAFLSLGYSFRAGALIRVSLLLDRVGPRARRLVELVCCALTLAAMAVPIWFFWLSLRRNFARGYTAGTISGLPVWIPEAVLLAGLVLFWLQLAAYGVKVGLGREQPEKGQAFGES